VIIAVTADRKMINEKEQNTNMHTICFYVCSKTII